MRIATLALAAIFTIGFAAESHAAPPPWAPAHGYRAKVKGKKRELYYVGYSGREYDRDYGISNGRCDRQTVGAVLGGVTGGVIGSQVGDRDNRVVATIIGAAIGALIGQQIGRDMDEGDRACVGHALELGTTGRRVSWANESDGRRYELVPGDGEREGGRICRNFTINTTVGRERISKPGRACQTSPGVWDLNDR